MKIKKILALMLSLCIISMNVGTALAIQDTKPVAKLQAAPNARTIDLAFVFDGPSDKNAAVLKTFQSTITRSLLPDYKASFPNELIFTGDWTESGVANVSEKALASKATMVISMGYMSSNYYSTRKNANKFVVTIDQYGLRDLGGDFFNPIQQYVKDFVLFKKLVPTVHKTAILMNENFYKTQKDWNGIITKKLKEKGCDIDFVVVPVNSDIKTSLSKISKDVDSVFVTPLFNLSTEQRKELYAALNSKKLPTFSGLGKEDVELGALLGTSTRDLDKKLAEATSFNIHGVLHGSKVKSEKVAFYDDEIIFYNSDTGEALGYAAPLRLLNNCEIISHKPVAKYDLTYVMNTLEEQNLDIARKKQLINAARRATTSAYLRYLPTLRMDLGHQSYNDAYATSYTDVPTRVGQFVLAMDQVIYSPDLVTNIIVKHKKLKFDKAQKVLTEATMGHELGNLYIDALIFENMIKVQEEYLQETRENLAIAKIRSQTGKCGTEEVLRWAGEVSEAEKRLLNMKADYSNVKIHINKILFKDQKESFNLAPLTAKDPAFFTSDIHIIDHVRTPEKLQKFTDMLVEEVIYLSPETTKLRAAIAMKKAEISNYAQKFVMPNAKLSLEYGTQFDRHLPYESSGHYPAANPFHGFMGPYFGLNEHSTRVLVAAQWKPIEGGTKIAEIARCKSELNELQLYLDQVNTELEMNVRSVVNRAIAKYFMIEKSYKAMFAEAENYQMVKARYLRGESPINQLVDAQHLYTKAKVEALNSQNEFFKELLWVQRGLVSMNWTKASEEAKKFIKKVPEILPAEADFSL
ncbi:TolC family protein [bacterium]|nr:TolC family protein [bacterium]